MSVYPGTTFSITITVPIIGSSAVPTVTLGALPSGITTTTPMPLTVPAGGASIVLQAASTAAAGNYNITFNAQAGSLSASANLSLAVMSGAPPAFYFVTPLFTEIGIPVGGSQTVQLSTGPNSGANYLVAVSVTGLPSGTSATVTPTTITPGQSVTLTMTASSTAPASQNAVVTLGGTPEAPVPAATLNLLVDVTVPSSSLPDNRSLYVSTEGTPYSAVYDSTHQLIFSSNPSWNRIDVISSTQHNIVKSISIRDSKGLDISQDNSTVWVATGSQQVFAINTSTFAITRYLLPELELDGAVFGLESWEGQQIMTLADGTFMLVFWRNADGGNEYAAIWNPTQNTLALLSPPVLAGLTFKRSGDGTRVYGLNEVDGAESTYYDVATGTFPQTAQLPGGVLDYAVSFDGSKLAIYDDVDGLYMWDGNFNMLGQLAGGGVLSYYQNHGGMIFSPDDQDLFEVDQPTDIPVVYTIDTSSLVATAVAPAIPFIPEGVELSPSPYMTNPIAIDSTGMLMGIQYFGIAFEDTDFSENLVTNQSGTPQFMNELSPNSGPRSGGTTSGGFGNAFSLTPGVWYGANAGMASLTSAGIVGVVSPPGSAQGPVDVKFLFPDGTEVYDPLAFSYGPQLQHGLISAGSPDGQVTAEFSGFGLPTSSAGGSLTVGGAAATLPSSAHISDGSPFSDAGLNFIVPPGSPGWANVTVNTPNGQSTLPNAFFYANSVTDYPSADTFTALLYDPGRNQLYLSAGNHIDVFSLAANQFVSPLNPPALGSNAQFAGMALTPGGSLLLATDLLDGSLAVINPDNPSASSAIAIAHPTSPMANCTVGPLFVAPTVNNGALVSYGGLAPANYCGPSGPVYQVNLSAGTAAPFIAYLPGANIGSNTSYLASTQDGTAVALAGIVFCIYNPVQQTFAENGLFQPYGAAFSADGNVAASYLAFLDANANVVGRIAQPYIYTDGFSENHSTTDTQLLGQQLDASGSLYFVPYNAFFDVMDVQHGTLIMRFGLTETVANLPAPMAVDPDGRYIFLITNKGLTVVDLGQAPLSIGWFSATSVSPGAQVTVRGSGFTSTTTATVGGAAAVVEFTDVNTITITVPAIPSGPADVVLSNGAGITYTLASALSVT